MSRNWLQGVVTILFIFMLSLGLLANAAEVIHFQETLDEDNNAFLAVTDHTFTGFNYSVFVHDGTLIYDDYPNSTYSVPVIPEPIDPANEIEDGTEEVEVVEIDYCASNNPKFYTHPQNSSSNCQNISLATQRLELSHKSNASFTLCSMSVGAGHLELADINIQLIGQKDGQEDQIQTLVFNGEAAQGYYRNLSITHSDNEPLWAGDFTRILISVTKGDDQSGILYFDDLVFSNSPNGCA
jgi:hypothetical protein